MNERNQVHDHPLIGQSFTYRPDAEPYDAATDTEPGVLVVGNGMTVTVEAAFHTWNGVAELDMLYVRCRETGMATHLTAAEIGIPGH